MSTTTEKVDTDFNMRWSVTPKVLGYHLNLVAENIDTKKTVFNKTLYIFADLDRASEHAKAMNRELAELGSEVDKGRWRVNEAQLIKYTDRFKDDAVKEMEPDGYKPVCLIVIGKHGNDYNLISNYVDLRTTCLKILTEEYSDKRFDPKNYDNSYPRPTFTKADIPNMPAEFREDAREKLEQWEHGERMARSMQDFCKRYSTIVAEQNLMKAYSFLNENSEAVGVEFEIVNFANIKDK